MVTRARSVISRIPIAVKILYVAAASLSLVALVYAGVAALVNGSAESPHDRIGIQTSFEISAFIAVGAVFLAIAAFIISRINRGVSRD